MKHRIGLFWHKVWDDGHEYGWIMWRDGEKIAELDYIPEKIGNSVKYPLNFRIIPEAGHEPELQGLLEWSTEKCKTIRYENRRLHRFVPWFYLPFILRDGEIAELFRDYRWICLPYDIFSRLLGVFERLLYTMKHGKIQTSLDEDEIEYFKKYPQDREW